MSEQFKENPARASGAGAPLSGCTVLITRARRQAAEFAGELERFGARVVECPTIEIVEPESYAALDQAVEDLFGYDWVVFTSVNGVEHFLRRLELKGLDVSALDDLRVCAIGGATADRLRDAQVHVDVVPEKFLAEGVYAALESYVGGREGLERLNFLIPRAAVARDHLPRALEASGARVDTVAAYRTVRPETHDRARVEALLLGGAVDCVTFTSASTVVNFAQLFGTGDLRPLIGGAAVACIGDITARAAADYGLRTHVRPAESTVSALARAIAEHFARAE